MFALSPALLLTATVNWDLLAVGFAAFGVLAWARRHPILAGVLLGLGGAAKMWPLFILGPILVLAARTGRWRAALVTIGTGAATLVLANLPVALAYRDSWLRFFRLNDERPIDWGTLWYIGRYLDGRVTPGRPGAVPVAERQRPLAQHPVVRPLRPGLPRDRRARAARAAPAPAGRARVPRRGGVPDLQQGVVAAVRAVAPAAGRPGPPALGGVPRLAVRRGLLLRRRSTASCSAPPASRSSRRASSCSRRPCGSPPW